MSELGYQRYKHLADVVGPLRAVDKITRAITNIDISRNARRAGDLGSAENALDTARQELIEVLGIDKETT